MSDSYLDGCPHCTVRFVNPSAIPAHIAEHHPNAAPSPGPVYEPPHIPGQPVYAKELPGSFVDALACPHCGAAAKNVAGLKSHIRSKHGTTSQNPPAA